MEKIENILIQAKKDIKIALDNKYKIIFIISQTNNRISNYLTPIRLIDDLFITGAVLDSTDSASVIAKELDYLVDFFYIDIEKKLAPVFESNLMDTRNFYSSICSIISKKKCRPIWPNRLTIDSCIKKVPVIQNNIRNLRIGVIGLGNLGFGVSKELINMGVHVFGKAREIGYREHIIENSLNLTKPSGTISSFKLVNSLEKLAISTDAVFLCTSSQDIINEKNYNMFRNHVLLLDVGKRNISLGLSSKKNCKWLDVSSSIVSYIQNDIISEDEPSFQLLKQIGTSAGNLAKPGEKIWCENNKKVYPIGEVCSSSGTFRRFSMREILKNMSVSDV